MKRPSRGSVAKAERDREQAETERSAGRDENAQAVQLLAEADREDLDHEQGVSEENHRPEALRDEAGINTTRPIAVRSWPPA